MMPRDVTCLECDQPAVGITRYCRTHQHDNWHGWFAWYPVLTLDGTWVWLTTVVRKRAVPKRWVPHYWWHPTFWYRVREEWI